MRRLEPAYGTRHGVGRSMNLLMACGVTASESTRRARRTVLALGDTISRSLRGTRQLATGSGHQNGADPSAKVRMRCGATARGFLPPAGPRVSVLGLTISPSSRGTLRPERDCGMRPGAALPRTQRLQSGVMATGFTLPD